MQEPGQAQPLHTRSRADVVTALDALVPAVQRQVRILSQDGDPELYSRDEFIELLGTFVRTHSRVARIRVLLADSRRAALDGNRLVDFWHRYTSFCEFRELRDEDRRVRESFFLADEIAIIRRADAGNPHTLIDLHALPLAPEKAAWFDQAWERAGPCTRLRRLTL